MLFLPPLYVTSQHAQSGQKIPMDSRYEGQEDWPMVEACHTSIRAEKRPLRQ